MRTKQNSLSRAVRLALSLGLVSSAAVIHAQDANQDNNKTAPPKETKTLQAIEVTGSLIRRVDTETASPVVTLSRQALTDSGNPTMGNILQALPSFGGFATNPQNNSNGGGVASPTLEGGDGASRISLRGLGDQRTLMLVDGHRLANADINMLPANMIERVDVLASGATTSYGSDAIGGVANFILRKDFSGIELSLNGGYSPVQDWSQSAEGKKKIKDAFDTAYPPDGNGARRGIELTVGATGDQGNVVGGLNYNKYSPMRAPARKDTAFQYYLYSSGLSGPSGSSNIPTGKLTLPSGDPLLAQLGCKKTTITRGSGDGTKLSDYRCRGATDVFNYNAYNYIQTQQERTNAFLLGNYKINDALTYYVDFFYNHTSSAGQDAPPLTSTGDGWIVPADNKFNPFGVTFCSTSFPNCPKNVPTYLLSMRLTGAGTRLHSFGSNNITLITGLKGAIGDTGWTWDADINYGRATRSQTNFHEPNIAGFQKAIDDGGNPFVQTSLPISITSNPQYDKTLVNKEASFNVSGDLFQMAAGPAQMSAGVLYRKQSMDYRVTSDAILQLSTLSCAVSAEACGSPGSGSFDVKELFGEALFPLLADAPLAKSLNIDVGMRHSSYDITGSTTNWKLALEYKPVDDLLVRGTATQVFRSPNTDELFDGPTLTNPTNTDFCQKQDAAFLAAHPNGCQYVPVGYSPGGGQIAALYQGGAVAGLKLKPEHGKSFDLGFVYSPGWAEGLSTTLDFWRISLSDLLTPLSSSTVFETCKGNDASPYCGLIHRNSAGADKGGINYVATAEVNLGNLSTSGVDFNVNYLLPEFAVPGRFKVGFESTYTSTFKVNIPNASNADYAGSYTTQWGNLSRLRATVTLNWKYDNWSAQWQARYINGLTVRGAFNDTGGGFDPKPSITYNSVKVGYAVPAWHTSFDLGIDNVFNRQPVLIYNGMNFNVDTATYDVMGRYVWGRATVKF